MLGFFLPIVRDSRLIKRRFEPVAMLRVTDQFCRRLMISSPTFFPSPFTRNRWRDQNESRSLDFPHALLLVSCCAPVTLTPAQRPPQQSQDVVKVNTEL